MASLKFPALRPITVTLTVTDSLGRQDVESQVVNSKAFRDVNGGGSGDIDPTTLVLLTLGVFGAFLRRQVPRAAMLRGRPARVGSPDSQNCQER